MDYMLEPPSVDLEDPGLYMTDDEIEEMLKSIAEDQLVLGER